MNSNYPKDNNNVFFIKSTPNQYSINMMNPFHPMVTMAITIEYPVFPHINNSDETGDTINGYKKSMYNYTLNDFLDVAYTFKEYLKDEENSIIYPLFLVLNEIAQESISKDIITSPKRWKLLVSLYTAHFLELMMTAWKDETNSNSLNPYEKKEEKKIDEFQNLDKKFWERTNWGVPFYMMYYPMARMYVRQGFPRNNNNGRI